MTARWTKETLALVMEALYEADGMPNQDKATDVLAALADAGLLVEPGSETREEWGIRFTEYHVSIRPLPTLEAAEAEILERTMHGYTYPGKPVSRTVHVGPWRNTDE